MNRIHHAIFFALASAVGTLASAQPKVYDNGPTITDPGAGFQGADASALQSQLGLQVLSLGCQVTQNNRLADDFTIEGCDSWLLNSFEFLAYQTGSGISESTFTSANVRIWDGEPGKPGSKIIWGDDKTNLLTSSTWSGIYRVTDMTLTVNQRPYFKNVCDLGGVLLQGPRTYWIDWQADGTIFSGPFVGAVSIKGETQKPGSNAVQYLGNQAQWVPAIDTGANKPAQDMPFKINYEYIPYDCYADCDANCKLDVDDFICFQTYYSIGDPYADCDGNLALNIDDFICFQTFFAVGC
jgi:hypothetical protein